MSTNLLKSIMIFFAILLFVPRVQAVPIATFVDSAFSISSAADGGAEYDFATVSVFIDPAFTNWIAWNNTTDVVIANAGCSGGFCLGPGGFGTDDFIRLTVVDPTSTNSLTVDLDYNNGGG